VRIRLLPARIRLLPIVQTSIALCVLTSVPVGAQEPQPAVTEALAGSPALVRPAASVGPDVPKPLLYSQQCQQSSIELFVP